MSNVFMKHGVQLSGSTLFFSSTPRTRFSIFFSILHVNLVLPSEEALHLSLWTLTSGQPIWRGRLPLFFSALSRDNFALPRQYRPFPPGPALTLPASPFTPGFFSPHVSHLGLSLSAPSQPFSDGRDPFLFGPKATVCLRDGLVFFSFFFRRVPSHLSFALDQDVSEHLFFPDRFFTPIVYLFPLPHSFLCIHF